MKKILFLILFLTGLCPVFNNNGLYLVSSQVYGQEDYSGAEVFYCTGTVSTVAYENDFYIDYEVCERDYSYELKECVASSDCHIETQNKDVDENDGGGTDDDSGSGGTGSTGGGSTGNTGGSGTTTPTKVGEPPITKAEFDERKANDYSTYKSEAKENQVLTLSTGAKVMGTLTRFENNLNPPHIFYYFTPYSNGYDFTVGMYYKIPDKDPRLPTASSSNSITSTFSNGIDGFPESGSSIISNLFDLWGQPMTVTIEPNNSPITVINDVPLVMKTWYLDKDRDGYHSDTRQATSSPGTGWKETTKGLDANDNNYYVTTATPLIGPEYNQSLPVNFGIASLDIRCKTENNSLLIAAVSKQIHDMSLSNLTTIVNYYNTNINNSVAVNANTIKAEIVDFPLNPALSDSTLAFHDWLASVIAIQTSSVYDDWEIVQSAIFKSIFEEDDDYAKVGQSDPFFVNNTDDPWRLKQYLSPGDTYAVGFVAGVGDGVIETADLAYNLVKYSINNSPSVLLYRLVTDTEDTIQEKLDEIQLVKGIVEVVFDKTKQEQIFNSIKALTINWFEDITFQKTNVQAGYQHGKIVFEILGALVGIEEVKALLKTGQFSANALSAINKLDDAFDSGKKIVKIGDVTHLVDDIGNPISKGDDIARVVNNLADPVNDVQKTVLNQFKTEVDSFADTIGDFTNKRKGNWGEMATDVKLSEKGYIPLHKRIDNIDAPGHNGIDGVFEKDGKYFIVESKYSKTGTPSLNPPNTSTGLPKQMSDEWIIRGTELEDAIGDPALAQEIFREGYTRVLVTHGSNDTVTYRLVNADGSLGAVWTP